MIILFMNILIVKLVMLFYFVYYTDMYFFDAIMAYRQTEIFINSFFGFFKCIYISHQVLKEIIRYFLIYVINCW